MWKPNDLIEPLERSCDLTSQPQVMRWYSVPTYPKLIGGNIMRLPVHLPAHEDKKAFNFSVWHYHIDLRFLHDNSIKKILEREFHLKYATLKKFVYIPRESPLYGEAKFISGNSLNGIKGLEGWEFGITNPKEIFETWYQFLCDSFYLAITHPKASKPGTNADYGSIRWKAQPCVRSEQEPKRLYLHEILAQIGHYKTIFKYCGKCPHRGVNLDSVPINEYGIKICPAHGGRWKISNGTIQIDKIIEC